MKLYIGLHM